MADPDRRERFYVMLSRRSRRVLVLVPAAAALVATSACGAVTASPSQAAVETGYEQAPNGDGNGNGNLAAAPQAKEPAAASGTADRVLAAFESATLGTVIVNGRGFAVYRFDKDTTKPSKSNCEGECVKTWVPVFATERTMVSELDAGLLGTVTRSDGSAQVTYAGSPLYTFTGDRAPGRVSGQGKGGTWWAVAPDGKKVAGAAASPSGSVVPGSGATGY
jgi:predicted lipoprotein with Yx(FWY)xxD motif